MSGIDTAVWITGLAVGVTCLVVGALASRAPIRRMVARGHGIVAFELARTPGRAARIRRDWGVEGRAAARTSLFADVPFLVGYGLLLATLAGWPSDRVGEIAGAGAGTVSRWMAGIALAAAALDLIEDVALLLQLRHGDAVDGGRATAPVAWACASLKFAGIAAVLAWSLCFVLPAWITAG